MARVDTNPLTQPLVAEPPWQSGRYYYPGAVISSGSTAALGSAIFRAYPVFVPNQVTLSRIGAEVTVVGDVGSKYRLGIYADDGTGLPAALVLDAGTIAGDVVAVQEIVVSQALGPGVFWLGGAVQAVTTTQPTIRTATHAIPVAVGTAIPAANTVPEGVPISGVAGALPNPAGITAAAGTVGSAPHIFVKVA